MKIVKKQKQVPALSYFSLAPLAGLGVLGIGIYALVRAYIKSNSRAYGTFSLSEFTEYKIKTSNFAIEDNELFIGLQNDHGSSPNFTLNASYSIAGINDANENKYIANATASDASTLQIENYQDTTISSYLGDGKSLYVKVNQ